MIHILNNKLSGIILKYFYTESQWNRTLNSVKQLLIKYHIPMGVYIHIILYYKHILNTT